MILRNRRYIFDEHLGLDKYQKHLRRNILKEWLWCKYLMRSREMMMVGRPLSQTSDCYCATSLKWHSTFDMSLEIFWKIVLILWNKFGKLPLFNSLFNVETREQLKAFINFFRFETRGCCFARILSNPDEISNFSLKLKTLEDNFSYTFSRRTPVFWIRWEGDNFEPRLPK